MCAPKQLATDGDMITEPRRRATDCLCTPAMRIAARDLRKATDSAQALDASIALLRAAHDTYPRGT